jgi:hypothetical protein
MKWQNRVVSLREKDYIYLMFMRNFFLAVVCLLCFTTFAQTNSFVIPADSLPYSLKRNWKYSTGDNPSFSKINFDDSGWKTRRPSLYTPELTDSAFNGFAWFRLHITLPQFMINKPLILDIEHSGASEIYIDGVQVSKYGKVSNTLNGEERFNPQGVTLPVIFKDSTQHLIAIRYSNHKFKEYVKWDDFYAGFFIKIDLDKNQTYTNLKNLFLINMILLCVAGFLFALTFIHVFFYVFYRKQKHHLYYSVFTFFFGLFFFLPYFSLNLYDPDITEPTAYLLPMVVPVYFISLAGFTHYLILEKLPRTLWLSILVGLIIYSGFIFKTGYNHYFYFILIGLVIHQTFAALKKGRKLKKPGLKIISRGFLIFALFVTLIGVNFLMAILGFSQPLFNIDQNTIYFLLPGILSVPVSISLYMARNFATLNITLEKKLEEVEELSAKSIEQEKEKQQILAEQNTILEQKVTERTAEVVAQKELLEEKQKEILDSIRYAKRIQTSLLPTETYIARVLKLLKK